MGKGKGVPVLKIFKIRCGMLLFEIEGLKTKIIINLLKTAKKKLPIKTKVVLIN